MMNISKESVEDEKAKNVIDDLVEKNIKIGSDDQSHTNYGNLNWFYDCGFYSLFRKAYCSRGIRSEQFFLF